MKIIIALLLSFSLFAQNQTWDSMSKSDQADLLADLEYTSNDELPKGTKLVTIWDYGMSGDFSSAKVRKEFQAYVKKAFSTFDNDISREEIEQSDYALKGGEELYSFYILATKKNKVLGAYMYVRQEGLDENGEEADISWSAGLRLDHEAKAFTDEDGYEVDDLYFGWTGH